MIKAEWSIMKARYILFFKKAFSSVLKGNTSKIFYGAKSPGLCSVYANHIGCTTHTKRPSFSLSFPKVGGVPK